MGGGQKRQLPHLWRGKISTGNLVEKMVYKMKLFIFTAFYFFQNFWALQKAVSANSLGRKDVRLDQRFPTWALESSRGGGGAVFDQNELGGA